MFLCLYNLIQAFLNHVFELKACYWVFYKDTCPRVNSMMRWICDIKQDLPKLKLFYDMVLSSQTQTHSVELCYDFNFSDPISSHEVFTDQPIQNGPSYNNFVLYYLLIIFQRG